MTAPTHTTASGGFTPGPWHALPTPFEDRIEAVAHPGSCIASTGNWLMSEKAEQHANARLIAAAPTMHAYIAVRAAAGDREAIQIMEAVRGNA